MGLLLHLNIVGVQDLPLGPGFPRLYPFTQMVSRVFLDKIDPFHTTLCCESIADILKLPSTTKSFGDVAAERAMELKACDAPIYIMYSGGVDSSSAVLAFLETWTPKELERVHILASHHTANEFPELWNIVVDTFKGRIHPSFRHIETYCEKGYVVTGEHGDQLFGSDIIRNIVAMFGDAGIHARWQDIMPAVYRKAFGPEVVDTFIARYETTLSACPFPIRSSFDWIWWFNFSNKWQHVKYRLLAHKEWRAPKENFKRIKHFYDWPLWQRWSFDNHDKKIDATYLSYKRAAKDYIIARTGFESYRAKPKVGSLSHIWHCSGFYEAIDTDFRYLNRQEALEYVR